MSDDYLAKFEAAIKKVEADKKKEKAKPKESSIKGDGRKSGRIPWPAMKAAYESGKMIEAQKPYYLWALRCKKAGCSDAWISKNKEKARAAGYPKSLICK